MSCSPSHAGCHQSQLRNKALCPISMEDVGFHSWAVKHTGGLWQGHNIDMRLDPPTLVSNPVDVKQLSLQFHRCHPTPPLSFLKSDGAMGWNLQIIS